MASFLDQVRKNSGATVEAEWANLCPLGIGETSDIAHGIVYLASDESTYVTGVGI
jgi:hypothetical protein